MSLKQNILNKIKSIEDVKLLHKLEQWLEKMDNKKSAGVKEESKTYTAKPVSSKKQNESEIANDALQWLKKIADNGGVTGIDDPVEWQKKERRDRSLPIH